MAIPDLQGPLDDFIDRMSQVRVVVVTLESASNPPHGLTTYRHGIDLANIDPKAGNTVNAMSLIFLASSFEEFIREEITQCAEYMMQRYSALHVDTRHLVRDAYWTATLQRLKFSRSILTKQKPKVPDVIALGKLGALVDSVRGFVVGDDAQQIEKSIFSIHANNFRPRVVDELALRLGIKELIASAAEASKIKTYFGVTRKSDAVQKLRAKLDEFYDRRNDTVHSLNGNTGYAVDVILDYLDIFEATAGSIKAVLDRSVTDW